MTYDNINSSQYQNYRRIAFDSSSPFCHARRPQLPAEARRCHVQERGFADIGYRHHPRRYHPCLPPDRMVRRPCPLL